MSFSVKSEEVSAAQAHAYLALSEGNRAINADYVLSLGVAMETGKWNAEASEIVFDESGALIDGHHRLHAIIAVDKTVRMLVKRGVTKSARGVIDTGRTRNMADLMRMFRPDEQHIYQRRAAINACVAALVPGRKTPTIRTFDAWDAWTRVFEPGLGIVITKVQGTNVSALRTGPVVGAFVFAHRTAPRKTEAMFDALIDGANLARETPVHSLRNYLLTGRSGRLTVNSRGAQFRKVLQCIYADQRGELLGKIQDGQKGLTYFRKAYAGSTDKLVALWTHPEAAPETH